ncbi:MAG: hypothetical protein E4H09_03105, partial [Spirochaetales bacterium]
MAYATLDEKGAINSTWQVVSNEPTPVFSPRHLVFQGNEYILAFSDPDGASRIVLYELRSGNWRAVRFLSQGGAASFGTFAEIGGRLHTFWQARASADVTAPTQIVYREPDQSALPPTLAAVNYRVGARSNQDLAVVRWAAPPDASGVIAYSYDWTQDPGAAPDSVQESAAAGENVAVTATADGLWYFSVRSLDRAGNWSPPASITYYRDTTPPPAVTFLPPPIDEDGALSSNTFTLRWAPTGDDVVVGYGYELFWVAEDDADPADLRITVPVIGGRIDTNGTSISRRNLDNGLWGLAVAPVDSVGNFGEPKVLLFRANKYIPVTQIATVVQERDSLGRYTIRIIGRGFATPDDRISQIYIDTDGVAPYDYIYNRTSGDFVVVNDRTITGLTIDDIATGDYYIGVRHPGRGVEFDRTRLVFERSGTIKFGNYVIRQGVEFQPVRDARGAFRAVDVIVWVVLILGGLLIVGSLFRLVGIAREAQIVRIEVRALIAGTALPRAEREARLIEMKNRGFGLRTKFTLLVVGLVVAIVGGLTFFLGSATLDNQRQALASSLYDRAVILTESIAAETATLVRSRASVGTLNDRVARIKSMPGEAYYATITGGPPYPSDWSSSTQVGEYDRLFDVNYVFASNDPIALGLVDPALVAVQDAAVEPLSPGEPIEPGTRVPFGRSVEVRQSLVEGYTAFGGEQDQATADLLRVLNDPVSQIARDFADDINTEARQALRRREQDIWAARQAFDETLSDADFANQQALRDQRNSALASLAGAVRTYPEFSVDNFDPDQTDYIFWYPLVDEDPFILNK